MFSIAVIPVVMRAAVFSLSFSRCKGLSSASPFRDDDDDNTCIKSPLLQLPIMSPRQPISRCMNGSHLGTSTTGVPYSNEKEREKSTSWRRVDLRVAVNTDTDV